MSKHIKIFCVAVLLILAVCPLTQASSDCDFTYSNYARAVQLHDMGDYDAALRHYHCALEEDPDDAVIPLLIANVYEDIESAGRAWTRVTSPTTAEILELPPLSSWGERTRPSYEQDFQDLVVVDAADSEPSLPSARRHVVRMTLSVVRSGDTLWLFYASGNNSFWLVLKRNQTTSDKHPVVTEEEAGLADEFIRQARIFVRNLDWTRAGIRFEQALVLDPSRVDIRCELGMVYQEIGYDRAALRQFEIVLAGDHLDSCAWSNREALVQRMRNG